MHALGCTPVVDPAKRCCSNQLPVEDIVVFIVRADIVGGDVWLCVHVNMIRHSTAMPYGLREVK